jgi:hypothetical protein
MYSSRGFGELGSTKKGTTEKVRDINQELDDLEQRDDSESDDGKNETMTCPNCK